MFKSKDPSSPDDQFLSTLTGPTGSNFYEKSDETLCFTLRGNTPIAVRMVSVIQLAINLPPVTVDDFLNSTYFPILWHYLVLIKAESGQ